MVALDHGGEGRPVASRAKVEEHWHVISATNCHFAPFDFFTLSCLSSIRYCQLELQMAIDLS
jgi:hypothetical protein